MGLLSWLGRIGGLLMAFRDPREASATEAWRRRREDMIPPEYRHKPTYDVYPANEVPPPIRLYVEARDVRGRLLREYVELEGYSVHQLNWKRGAMRGGVPVRDWFVGQMLEAVVRLAARLDQVKEAKEQP